ncbi:hypothetical protein Cni_G19600 [Canna indica]|uniref:Uncharacterized protein n=1 Tax=Canna indica TaxID=4628 RepID=A0AAQ3KRP6_9LILI|nr:hypothetical protein Cni_G19600 [Canna indica]
MKEEESTRSGCNISVARKIQPRRKLCSRLPSGAREDRQSFIDISVAFSTSHLVGAKQHHACADHTDEKGDNLYVVVYKPGVNRAARDHHWSPSRPPRTGLHRHAADLHRRDASWMKEEVKKEIRGRTVNRIHLIIIIICLIETV